MCNSRSVSDRTSPRPTQQRKMPMQARFIAFAALASFALLAIENCLAQEASPAGLWKAGVAKADITPKKPLWLAGYGGRDHVSEGTLHPIWIKALALEDAQGYRLVLLTSDLCGLPKWMYDSVCETLHARHGLGREQIRLTNSHNHCAPAVRGDLEDYYGWNDR